MRTENETAATSFYNRQCRMSPGDHATTNSHLLSAHIASQYVYLFEKCYKIGLLSLPFLFELCEGCKIMIRIKAEVLIYRVIQNDCRGFNNLSYTIHLR